ncbi:type II CRISPR RNA-guided endonuclease Cas9 [Prosthecomicrobium hirschii]|uniref:type II CRISPR RNA-guided endonuclease Cas9 n=1 Tax=Prosthecodimorpha hirschii TaxID=665126 RepID=UPI00112ACE53|nr:type II CRISPR RNA-guided endonuclease Cas9 [Prosthecomicrobium hirschii]TPQ46989.1 type II CRISPR RNA-guided endonuclease Cas9 [Prosthecomicrobium hirschii]
MALIFGLDIGTTSIGSAVVVHEPDRGEGKILHLGVRVFPEARDPKGTPLNQQRRAKRMARRQLRRRKSRRRSVNELLSSVGLLPTFGSDAWHETMRLDPYTLRDKGLDVALAPHELGRAIYHLSKHRHFAAKELDDSKDEAEDEVDEEKEAAGARQSTIEALRREGITLGRWLARKPDGQRKRGAHALRSVVEDEYHRLLDRQRPFHSILSDQDFTAALTAEIFAQRPVFWRKNTLGACPLIPGASLCPRGTWLSQQRRMLEKVNNLAIGGGNARPLDPDERAIIIAKVESQPSATFGALRMALKGLYKSRGEEGREKSLRFNFEDGGETRLLGNSVEARLLAIFGDEWSHHPHKEAIRDAVHQRLWSADYAEIGQRVVIRPAGERMGRRRSAARSFITEFGVTEEQAEALERWKLPAGWEPYSTEALLLLLPELEAGVRFGALTVGPDWETWRERTFPDRMRPTGEFVDRLPSPKAKEESDRLANLRNPTVVRCQNELRKVVNNLIDAFGKPDLMRIELAREVGASKLDREKMTKANREQEKRRKAARADLQSKGIAEPARRDIEKWLLWKECGERDPYTGSQIGFDALFRNNEFDIEHIWPRGRSLDDSFRNKTLCQKDVNLAKGNRTPFEYFAHVGEDWEAIKRRLGSMIGTKSGDGMSPGKAKRFLAEAMPEDFASRQLNDTGYSARQAVASLTRLWPDQGRTGSVRVFAVNGRVTAHIRRLWGLNNILSDDGEKTRADHRHHAIDALVVACTDPGMTNRLSRFWQSKDELLAGVARSLSLDPPWPGIRSDAERAAAAIIVSHRVNKKVSGPLHKETTYGDTGTNILRRGTTYRRFVTTKQLLNITVGDVGNIVDPQVRHIVATWIEERGGNPKKAFPPFPRVSEFGPEIRKVRIHVDQQVRLMAPASTGYADLGNNHHVAVYRTSAGEFETRVVSLFEAARRLAAKRPVIERESEDTRFIMSLAAGESIAFSGAARTGLWIVRSIWANGQVVIEAANDAIGATKTQPQASSILRDGGRKVSVDPIGRIRTAGD